MSPSIIVRIRTPKGQDRIEVKDDISWARFTKLVTAKYGLSTHARFFTAPDLTESNRIRYPNSHASLASLGWTNGRLVYMGLPEEQLKDSSESVKEPFIAQKTTPNTLAGQAIGIRSDIFPQAQFSPDLPPLPPHVRLFGQPPMPGRHCSHGPGGRCSSCLAEWKGVCVDKMIDQGLVRSKEEYDNLLQEERKEWETMKKKDDCLRRGIHEKPGVGSDEDSDGGCGITEEIKRRAPAGAWGPNTRDIEYLKYMQRQIPKIKAPPPPTIHSISVSKTAGMQIQRHLMEVGFWKGVKAKAPLPAHLYGQVDELKNIIVSVVYWPKPTVQSVPISHGPTGSLSPAISTENLHLSTVMAPDDIKARDIAGEIGLIRVGTLYPLQRVSRRTKIAITARQVLHAAKAGLEFGPELFGILTVHQAQAGTGSTEFEAFQVVPKFHKLVENKIVNEEATMGLVPPPPPLPQLTNHAETQPPSPVVSGMNSPTAGERPRKFVASKNPKDQIYFKSPIEVEGLESNSAFFGFFISAIPIVSHDEVNQELFDQIWTARQ